jgi:hypothetical protein
VDALGGIIFRGRNLLERRAVDDDVDAPKDELQPLAVARRPGRKRMILSVSAGKASVSSWRISPFPTFERMR